MQVPCQNMPLPCHAMCMPWQACSLAIATPMPLPCHSHGTAMPLPGSPLSPVLSDVCGFLAASPKIKSITNYVCCFRTECFQPGFFPQFTVTGRTNQEKTDPRNVFAGRRRTRANGLGRQSWLSENPGCVLHPAAVCIGCWRFTVRLLPCL